MRRDDGAEPRDIALVGSTRGIHRPPTVVELVHDDGTVVPMVVNAIRHELLGRCEPPDPAGRQAGVERREPWATGDADHGDHSP
jgi:hypothetical protein